PLPPEVVIAVLPPTGGIGADRLKVSVRIDTDPHGVPCRRDPEAANALERVGVGDTPPVRIDVLEPLSPPPPDDPGRGAVDAAQAGHGHSNGAAPWSGSERSKLATTRRSAARSASPCRLASASGARRIEDG